MNTHPDPRANRNTRASILRCGFALVLLAAALGMAPGSLPPASATEYAAATTARPELVLQTGHVLRVDGIAFSPDGKLLASGSADSTVRLWDTASRCEVRTLAGHTGGVRAVAFRPDGLWLASGGVDGEIKLWDVATGRELRTLSGNGSVRTIAFSADGRWLAVGNMQKAIKLWDLTAEREPLTLVGHTGIITIVAFSPAGHWLASGSGDQTVRIWDLQSGREQRSLVGHTAAISMLTFNADGTVLATGAGTTVKLWQVATGSEQKFPHSSADKVLAAAFSPDGQTLITAYSNKGIKQHQVSTGRELSSIVNNSGEDVLEAISMTFSIDGRWLASSTGDKTIELRDVATGRDVHSLTTHSFGVFATAFSAGGHWLATGGQEATVKLWEVATGRELITLNPNGGYVNSVAFSPDELWLASGTLSGKITLWEVRSGKKLRDLSGHTSSVNSIAFSPDGKWLVSASNDQSIKLWNPADGSQVRSFAGHSAEASAVAFSPDGNWIVSGSADKSVRIWETASGKELRNLKGHTGEVLAVAVSPDGQSIASAGTDKLVKIWNAATGREASTLIGHTAEVKAVTFSNDGQSLISGSRDDTIKVWQAATGQLTNTLPGHTGEVYSLSFSADGRWLASGSDDGSTGIWNTKTWDPAATLISLRESAAGFSLLQTDWLVVSPDGLFDGSPGAWHQILWRFEQNTSNVRPVEVFFNEFFFPGLLGEILAGKKPPVARDIKEIDRRQPLVALTVADEKAAAGKPIERRNLAVKIQVAEAALDKDHPAGSGVKDVRLFRNGSLVKVWHGELDTKGGNAVLETSIPIIAGVNELTAYAFNRNNIKSSDATVVVNGADSLKRSATAYLISVGLNTYANTGYNLKYAAPDATDFRDEVRLNEEKLLGRFAHVEMVSLLNEEGTKANILTALGLLGGDQILLSAKAPAALQKLKAAQPEDAVVLFFAGHGLADHGSFYMLPHDLGYAGSRRRLDEPGFQSIMSHSVSDRELEQAFEKIGAAQILFVIDACNSGQALEADEKRRGPMNSKGLAQLAYEKGMYILTAAQSYQAALEADELGHGLLTYALIEEGLKKVAADQNPKDGLVFLREWFDYATSRVPQLQVEKMQQGRNIGKDTVAFVEGEDQIDMKKRNLQRPRSFYRRDIPVPLIAVSQQAPGQVGRQ